METKKYIFSLDYGNRMEEKEFIKAVLREFDSNTLVGCGIFVNNNPYCLELLFFASLEKDTDRFEDFMKKHFNDNRRRTGLQALWGTQARCFAAGLSHQQFL